MKNRKIIPKRISEKNFSTSKNRKLQIVRNAFCRSFVPIGAMFAEFVVASAGFAKRKQLRFDYGWRHGNFFAKLWTDVYPSNMAPIGAKLWENAFRTICNFWFFDAKNFFEKNFLTFWNFFWRFARFGGASPVSALVADRSRKVIACSSFIFSLRALMKG